MKERKNFSKELKDVASSKVGRPRKSEQCESSTLREENGKRRSCVMFCRKQNFAQSNALPTLASPSFVRPC